MPSTSQQPIPIKKRVGSKEWVDARTLHDWLKSKKEFSSWIWQKIRLLKLLHGKDYKKFNGKSTGGRPPIEYLISLDAAFCISMLSTKENGNVVRRYLIKCEKQLRRLVLKNKQKGGTA